MVGLQTNDDPIMYYTEEGDVRVMEVNEKTSQFKTEGSRVLRQHCSGSVPHSFVTGNLGTSPHVARETGFPSGKLERTQKKRSRMILLV